MFEESPALALRPHQVPNFGSSPALVHRVPSLELREHCESLPQQIAVVGMRGDCYCVGGAGAGLLHGFVALAIWFESIAWRKHIGAPIETRSVRARAALADGPSLRGFH
jgi:hypothetical protein